MIRYLKFCPNHIFGVGETRHFKRRVLIDSVQRCTSARMIDYRQKGGHVTSLSFGKCDNISETVQDRDIVAMKV